MKNMFLFVLILLNIQLFSKDSDLSWGKNLTIEENVYCPHYHFLKLSDGSFWDLNYTYNSFWDHLRGQDAQALWLKPQKVEITYSDNYRYPYLITNLETQEQVEAKQMDPDLLTDVINYNYYYYNYIPSKSP